MKTLVLLICALPAFAIFSAKAQPGTSLNNDEFIRQFTNEWQQLPNQPKSTAKTTAEPERVISTCRFFYDTSWKLWTMVDSFDFTWSYGRYSQQNNDVFLGTEINIDAYDAKTQQYSMFFPLFPHYRVLQTFDSDGNLIEKLHQNQNPSTFLWENVSKTEYSYASKLKTSEIYIEADEKTGKWNPARKHVYSYSGAELIEDLRQWWDEKTASWVSAHKTSYVYVSGYLTEKKTETLNLSTGKWEISAHTKTDYTFSGTYITESATSSLNTSTLKWELNSRDSSIYAGTLLTEKWGFAYDKSGKLYFKGFNKYSYTAGLLTERISGYEEGKPKGKAIYTYDGGLLTQITFNTYKGSSSWDSTNRFLFTYNKNGRLLVKEQQEWRDGEWKPIITNDEFDTRLVYYYEPFSTKINDFKTTIKNTSLFPNPASTHVYVDYFTETNESSKVTISNMLGQEMMSKTEAGFIGDHSVLFPVQSLAQGTYLVSIFSNGQLSKTLKLIR